MTWTKHQSQIFGAIPEDYSKVTWGEIRDKIGYDTIYYDGISFNMYYKALEDLVKDRHILVEVEEHNLKVWYSRRNEMISEP